MAIPTLVLGSMNLTDWSGSAYSTQVMVSGTSKGAPVPLNIAIQSFLQNGSIIVTQGYDNREMTLRVQFRGTSLTAVAQAEAALFAELGKPNLLTWTPASGPPAVFVVVTSSMEEAPGDEWDLAEAQPFPWRYYNVRLTCEAFPRSLTPFTSVGVAPSGSTTTTLDTMGATTGWTGTIDGVAGTVVNAVGPPTVNSINGAPVALGGNHTATLQKTFAATTTTTNLLMVDWAANAGTLLSAFGDGVSLPRFAQSAAPTSGYVRTWFKVAAPSLAVTKFSALSSLFTGETQTFQVDNVAVTNVIPTTGTARQVLRSLDVPGSAPTPASLAVESSSAALGDALVYVYPANPTTNGYSPSLRQFRVLGNTVTSNAALVSGSSEPLGPSLVTFQIPIALMPPGSYTIVGRLATSGGGTPTITCVGSTYMNGSVIGVTPGVVRTITTTTAYQNFALGRIQLPSMDVDKAGSTAGVMVEFDVIANTSTCTYDEFWLFNTTIGYLAMVNCGTGSGTSGGAARRLYLDQPTVTTPRPTIRVGHNADRSDSHYPKLGVGASEMLTAWQAPRFTPPQANVLTVTSNATDVVVSLSGYARWHSNPGS